MKGWAACLDLEHNEDMLSRKDYHEPYQLNATHTIDSRVPSPISAWAGGQAQNAHFHHTMERGHAPIPIRRGTQRTRCRDGPASLRFYVAFYYSLRELPESYRKV